MTAEPTPARLDAARLAEMRAWLDEHLATGEEVALLSHITALEADLASERETVRIIRENVERNYAAYARLEAERDQWRLRAEIVLQNMPDDRVGEDALRAENAALRAAVEDATAQVDRRLAFISRLLDVIRWYREKKHGVDGTFDGCEDALCVRLRAALGSGQGAGGMTVGNDGESNASSGWPKAAGGEGERDG